MKIIAYIITYENGKYEPQLEIRSPLEFLFCNDSRYSPDKTPFTITPIFDESA